MLGLTLRLVAITACVFGIYLCARVSEEVFKGHADEQINDGTTSSAQHMNEAGIVDQLKVPRPELRIDTSRTSRDLDYVKDPVLGVSTMLVDLLSTATRTLELVVDELLPPRHAKWLLRWQRKLDTHTHWTASRTQIHPAIA